MKKLFTLLIILNIVSAKAQTFVPNHQKIGDTTFNYVNPEFSPSGKRYCMNSRVLDFVPDDSTKVK